jgi:hypothetical protein
MNKIFSLLAIISLFSCTRWTTNDEQEFMNQCERNKLDIEYCECALEKIKSNFTSYKKMFNNEAKTAELFVDCL